MHVCGRRHTKAVMLQKPEIIANAIVQIPDNYNKRCAQYRTE